MTRCHGSAVMILGDRRLRASRLAFTPAGLLAVLAEVAVTSCLLLPCVAQTGGTKSATQPLPVDLALARKEFSVYETPVVSPDGGSVAYIVVTPTRRMEDGERTGAGTPDIVLGNRLLVADVATGSVVQVSLGESNAWEASWSPDGSALAFLSDAGGVVGVWTWRPGAVAARLGKATASGWAHMRPQWTPDGTELLVALADPQRKRESGEVLERAGAMPARDDGPLVEVRTSGAERPLVVRPGAEAGFETIDRPSAIGSVNVADGSAVVLLPADHPTAPAAALLSPTGKFLLVESALRSPGGPLETEVSTLSLVRRVDGAVLWSESGFRLDELGDSATFDGQRIHAHWHATADRLVFVKGGKVYAVEAGDEPKARELDLGAGHTVAGPASFTYDGAAVVVPVRGTGSTADGPTVDRVLLLPLAGGVAKVLTGPADVVLRSVVRADVKTAWQPTKDAVVVVGTKSGESVYTRLPTNGTEAAVLGNGDRRTFLAAAAGDHRIAVGVVEDPQTPPDLYTLDPDLKPGTRLSRIEPRLDDIALGAVEYFETTVEVDGKPKVARAAVVLPAGAKKGDKLPTIVGLYPGANYSRAGSRYGGGDLASLPSPLFTTRGYAVLLVDVPLAPEGQPSNPLADTVAAVVPQVERAVALGYTDRGRVAVIGHSYGGYGAACLASSTNLFRAAIPIAGVFDLAGGYASPRGGDDAAGVASNMVWSEQQQGRMGKPLWDDRKRYLDNSPYFGVERIETPLLLVHGRADETCPVLESEKMFNALRRLDRTAQLAIYEGEGHVPGEWSRANVVDLAHRVLAFLDRHVMQPAGSGR